MFTQSQITGNRYIKHTNEFVIHDLWAAMEGAITSKLNASCNALKETRYQSGYPEKNTSMFEPTDP